MTEPRRFAVRRPGELNRYRFGLRTADFLVRGVYVGAIFDDGDEAYTTLNVNTFDELWAFPWSPVPAGYDHETEAERRSRRRAAWTPIVAFVEGVAR